MNNMNNIDNNLISKFDNYSNISTQSVSNAVEKKKPIFEKIWIDGTIQRGILIDENGKCNCGEKEEIDLGGGLKRIENKLIEYPKNKGFTLPDGKGNYFYFPPLPDFKMANINRLQKIKDDADTTKSREVADINRLQKIKDDADTTKSREVADRIAATLKEKEDNKSKKTKWIIGLSIVTASVIGLFIWKKS
jgi:hypothetical protein